MMYFITASPNLSGRIASTQSNSRNALHRVCAVGSPGIVKTMITPLLICMLLREGYTIVYYIHTKE
jgi:hypothetical protein